MRRLRPFARPLTRPLVLGVVVSVVAGSGLVAAGAVSAAPVTSTASTRSTGSHSPSRDAIRWAGRRSVSASDLARFRTELTRPAQPRTRLAAGLAGSGSGTVQVTVSGDDAAVASAIHRSGGSLLAAVHGEATATVPAGRLSELAAAPGVTSVGHVDRAYPTSGPVSEGVSASNAGPATQSGTWQAAGVTGSGVSVAVIDAGFGGLSAAVASGDLPAGQTADGSHCTNVDDTDHGTAVAEIVHQMAPDATLYLYCVNDNVGLQQVVAGLPSSVKIINTSLDFPGDSRGDGSGAANSAAATVAAARKRGILWVTAAGNDAADHWSGTFADANKDGFVDLAGTSLELEQDGILVAGTDDVGAGGGQAGITLQWDQWPTSSAPITLGIYGFQCTDDQCSSETKINNGAPYIVTQSAGSAPVLQLGISNTTPYEQQWSVLIGVGAGFPKVHYDLSYEGDVSPSYLASAVSASRAAQGSIAAPASSPYALAVGAADVGADGKTAGTLEPFSSQGPTIDGRIKPDITAYDGVSSPVYGTPSSGGTGGFYGTSAATPTVAGAAALVAQQNPTWDAAQIQNFLEQRASGGSPSNPPLNSVGHGLLTLGDPTTTALPATSKYSSVAPVRLLDTRTIGAHGSPLGAGGTRTITVPNLPTGTTAVAINLTGTAVTAATYLTAYPGGSAAPGTSNVNLDTKTSSTAAVLAVVLLGPGNTITIRNNLGQAQVIVDLLGYFGQGDAFQGGLVPVTPNRVLDTRQGKPFANTQSIVVHPNLPANAGAAVVNVTGTGAAQPGYFAVTATCPTSTPTTSTLNYAKTARANMAVTQLAPDGTFCITNIGATTQGIIDVSGYFSSDGSGSGFVPLPSPTRIVDTRTNMGGSAGNHSPVSLAQGAAPSFTGGGVGDVPHGATALFTNLTEASDTMPGYLAILPGATATPPSVSSVNFVKGQIVANAAVVGLTPAADPDTSSFEVYNCCGYTHAVVDLFGYFV